MDLESRVATAGAYVLADGLVVFMVGPNRAGDRLGVVRLGGHREAGETSWTCAGREVLEEASVRIRPIPPPATYWGARTEEVLGPLLHPDLFDG
jgi:8-oxo-dGTP pyrophosphatase MutT (NUDIX family)